MTAIDVATRKSVAEIPVGVEPEGMALSPDGKVLVNTSETTNMAHLIDTQTRKIFANVLVDARPRAAQYTPDGFGIMGVVRSRRDGQRDRCCEPRKSNRRSSSRSRAFRRKPSSRSVCDLPRTAKGLSWRSVPANRVAVIDTATKKVEKYLLVGQRVWQLAFTPDAKYLYTTNGVSNDVSVIDVASLKVVKSIAVGSFPWGVAIARQ